MVQSSTVIALPWAVTMRAASSRARAHLAWLARGQRRRDRRASADRTSTVRRDCRPAAGFRRCGLTGPAGSRRAWAPAREQRAVAARVLAHRHPVLVAVGGAARPVQGALGCPRSPRGPQGRVLLPVGDGEPLDDDLLGLLAGKRRHRQVGYVGVDTSAAAGAGSRRGGPASRRTDNRPGAPADARNTASRPGRADPARAPGRSCARPRIGQEMAQVCPLARPLGQPHR